MEVSMHASLNASEGVEHTEVLYKSSALRKIWSQPKSMGCSIVPTDVRTNGIDWGPSKIRS